MWEGRQRDLRSIDTIYFGGGTPSALAPENLGRILEAARENLSVRDDVQVFFEANPEDVTPVSVRAWRDLGVRFPVPRNPIVR